MTNEPFMRRLRDTLWAHDALVATLVFLVTRTCLAVFVWLTGQYLGCTGIRCNLHRYFADNFLLNGLFQWDAQQYQVIAAKGFTTKGIITAPFFPAFPFLARLGGRIIGSDLAAGIVLNNLCAVVGAVFASALARLAVGHEATQTGRELGRNTILFWLAAPVSLFFSVFLTESLFSCFAAIALWSVYRGRWVAFGLAAALLTATRVNGMIVVFAAAVIAWERRREVKLSLATLVGFLLAPLGLVWMLYLQHQTYGDAFAWVAAQRHWGRHLVLPTKTLHDDWRGFPGVDPLRKNVDAMYRTQELLAAALTLPFLFLRRHLGLGVGLWILGLLTWLMPLSSHSIICFARYQAGNLYFAIAMPAFLTRHRPLQPLAWWGFGLAIAWYASTYPHGVWAS